MKCSDRYLSIITANDLGLVTCSIGPSPVDWFRRVTCRMLYGIYLNSMYSIAVVVAAPLEGPVVVDGKPGRNEAELIWREIPQHRRRGFITNYTISYTSGSDIHSMYPQTDFSLCIYISVFSVI